MHDAGPRKQSVLWTALAQALGTPGPCRASGHFLPLPLDQQIQSLIKGYKEKGEEKAGSEKGEGD